MRKKTALTCWLIASAVPFVFLVGGCRSVRTIDLQADHPEAKAQIERRVQEILVAAERKDFDRLEGYHLYGPKFTRFSGSSPARMDAAATRKLEHDGLASLNGLKMRADDVKIDVFGSVGVATFILDYTFEAGGEILHRRERSTLVLVEERGSWRIAHEHLSQVILAEPGGPANESQPIRAEANRTSSAAGSRR